MTVNLSRKPSSEKLVTVIFNSSTLISRRVGGGVRGVRTNPLYRSVMAEEKALNEEVEQLHEVTMRESRMSALVLMHIKYDMPVNFDEIVNLFEGLHPKMMQFTSLVYDYQ